MKYNKFKNELNFLKIKSLVTDESVIAEMKEKIKNNQPLPEDISYEVNYKYNPQGQWSANYKIFKNNADEEIETALKISQIYSLHSISKTLLFFKTLAIISIVIMLVFALIGLMQTT